MPCKHFFNLLYSLKNLSWKSLTGSIHRSTSSCWLLHTWNCCIACGIIVCITTLLNASNFSLSQTMQSMKILVYKTLGTSFSSLSLGQMSLSGTAINYDKIIILPRPYQFTPSPIVNESVCFLQSSPPLGIIGFPILDIIGFLLF